MAEKVHVGMIAEYKIDGRVFPRTILLEDGRKVPIDRVRDVRQAASLKCGGSGLRYICDAMGREIVMFLDFNQWWVEGK